MTRPPEVLTQDEATLMLSQANRRTLTGLRNRCVMEVMYRAGLRVSEVTNLKPRDVRLAGDRPRLEVRNSKGGKSRNIPLPDSSVILLEQWSAKRPDGEWFFCTTCERGGKAKGNAAGAKLTPRYLQLMVKRYALRACIDRNVTPHLFRHSYATELLKRPEFNIREVQLVMGHAHVGSTQIYTHVNHDDIAAKIAVL